MIEGSDSRSGSGQIMTDPYGPKLTDQDSQHCFHLWPKVRLYSTLKYWCCKSRKRIEGIRLSRINSSQCMAVLWSWSRNYIAIAAPAPFYLSQTLKKFYWEKKIMIAQEVFENCYQCCGSMPFWGGSGSGSSDPCLWLMDPDPDPAMFVIDLQDVIKKLIFEHNFFCLLLFIATFTSFFKDKKSKRVTKYWESRFVLLFLHDDRRIRIQSRIRIHTFDYWIRIREAQKRVDPDSDPDPQHWLLQF